MEYNDRAALVVRVDEHTVQVRGDIDTSSEAEFRRALREAAAGTRTLDLTGVAYLGSAGLAVLFEFAATGLRLRVQAGSALAKVMDISGLSRLATVRIDPC
jgi:anti-anti-sigma factor